MPGKLAIRAAVLASDLGLRISRTGLPSLQLEAGLATNAAASLRPIPTGSECEVTSPNGVRAKANSVNPLASSSGFKRRADTAKSSASSATAAMPPELPRFGTNSNVAPGLAAAKAASNCPTSSAAAPVPPARRFSARAAATPKELARTATATTRKMRLLQLHNMKLPSVQLHASDKEMIFPLRDATRAGP